MKSMIIGTLVELERLNNSVYGNPRYLATIKEITFMQRQQVTQVVAIQ